MKHSIWTNKEEVLYVLYKHNGSMSIEEIKKAIHKKEVENHHIGDELRRLMFMTLIDREIKTRSSFNMKNKYDKVNAYKLNRYGMRLTNLMFEHGMSYKEAMEVIK